MTIIITTYTIDYYTAIFGIYSGGWSFVITGNELCTIDVGFNQEGYDLHGSPITVNSPGECCDACADYSDCKSWVFNTKSYQCHLKSEYPGIPYLILNNH